MNLDQIQVKFCSVKVGFFLFVCYNVLCLFFFGHYYNFSGLPWCWRLGYTLMIKTLSYSTKEIPYNNLKYKNISSKLLQ